MSNILKKLHIFILLYGAFEIYQAYEGNLQQIEEFQNKIPKIQAQISKERKEKQILEKYFKDIKDAKARIELVAQKLENLQKQLPEEVSDAENLNLVRQIAEGVNMKNILLSPGEDKVNGFYISKDYRLKSTGTYLQTLVFLEKLGQQERILNVKSILMEKEKGKQKGRFVLLDSEIILESFRHNKNYKEDRGIDTIEENFKTKTISKPIKGKGNKKS